jgi:ketosteroid isomerase-like protein
MRRVGFLVVGLLLAAAPDEREAMLQADRDFDKATAEKGVDGWVSFFDESGMMFPDGRDIVKGRGAVRDLMAAAFARPGYSLRWKPAGVEVARSGDLGYTWGHAVIRAQDQQGKPVTRYSKYVTIWKKQADGSWKVAVDIGTSSPAPG